MLNGLSDRVRFVEASIGAQDLPSVSFVCDSTRGPLNVRQLAMEGLCDLVGNRVIEVLHCDAQGIEYGFLGSMKAAVAENRIRFLMLSTHHYTFSGSHTTHEDCLTRLKELGATVHVEHNLAESFSGDGLILTSFRPEDRLLNFPSITRNVAERSLFGT